MQFKPLSNLKLVQVNQLTLPLKVHAIKWKKMEKLPKVMKEISNLILSNLEEMIINYKQIPL